jgi:hypothetical protein
MPEALRNVLAFYCEVLLTPRPIHNLNNRPLSAVRNVFTVILYIMEVVVFSRNLKTSLFLRQGPVVTKCVTLLDTA